MTNEREKESTAWFYPSVNGVYDAAMSDCASDG